MRRSFAARERAADLVGGADRHDRDRRRSRRRRPESRGSTRPSSPPCRRYDQTDGRAGLASNRHHEQDDRRDEARANREATPRAHGQFASGQILLRLRVYSSAVPVHLVQHPIAQDALLSLRDSPRRPSHFRRLTHRLSLFVAIEATRKLPMTLARVETPLEPAQGEALDGGRRRGAGPPRRPRHGGRGARAAAARARRPHRTAARRDTPRSPPATTPGCPRDLTAARRSSSIRCSPPAAAPSQPSRWSQKAGAKDIRLVCIVAAPEGIAAVEAAHPTLPIFTPVDRSRAQRAEVHPAGPRRLRRSSVWHHLIRRDRRQARPGRRASRRSSRTRSSCAATGSTI